ncbi:MAG: hypothetical protein JWQ46_2160 [Phenylobacterium sp.]|nr:hypothetical protein [Phenylobacterium sp.]
MTVGTTGSAAPFHHMATTGDFIKDAEAAELMAALVSYRPDKDRLNALAAELRRKAAGAADAPRSGRRH